MNPESLAATPQPTLALSVFLFPKKSLTTFITGIQALASIGFIEETKLVSCKSCLIWGPSNTLLFFFAIPSTSTTKCRLNVVKPPF